MDTPHIALAPAERTGELARDGRQIGWAEWGPRDGAPVVFCTGAGMASTLGFGAAAVRDLGVRLICVDRAGLGRSSPDPAKSLARHATDVTAVLAHLGVARARAVGFSQGGPFAVALAALGPIDALALVAATDELARPRVRARLVPDVARLIDAIAADAAGFERAFAAQADAAGLWRLVLDLSAPEDRARYAEPAFAAAYRAALDAGFAQGAAGYARDLVLASQPWPTPPEAITVPVALWYGGRDTSPVHSPDHGAELAARFPRATRHLRPDEGGALLWTCARDILADLLARGQ